MERRIQRGKSGNQDIYDRRNCYSNQKQFCGDVVSGFIPKDKCGKCGLNEFDNTPLRDLPLGMTYVPWQCYEDVFECEYEALSNGTIFKKLVLEFQGRSCR